jgi:putative FmdB family regulatory protein
MGSIGDIMIPKAAHDVYSMVFNKRFVYKNGKIRTRSSDWSYSFVDGEIYFEMPGYERWYFKRLNLYKADSLRFGNVIHTSYFVDNKKIRKIVYYENRLVAQIANYDMSENLHGKFSSYDESGKPLLYIFYEHGSLLSESNPKECEMPLFTYLCKDCGNMVEKFVQGKTEVVCDQCGGVNCEKQFSAGGSRSELSAKDFYNEKIRPEADRIFERACNGSDADFLDIAGDK